MHHAAWRCFAEPVSWTPNALEQGAMSVQRISDCGSNRWATATSTPQPRSSKGPELRNISSSHKSPLFDLRTIHYSLNKGFGGPGNAHLFRVLWPLLDGIWVALRLCIWRKKAGCHVFAFDSTCAFAAWILSYCCLPARRLPHDFWSPC